MESVHRAVQRIDAGLSVLGEAERHAVARSSEMTALELQAALQGITAALIAGRLHASEAAAFLAALDQWSEAPIALRVATILGLREALQEPDHERPCVMAGAAPSSPPGPKARPRRRTRTV